MSLRQIYRVGLLKVDTAKSSKMD